MDMDDISAQTTIAALLSVYPHTASIFLRRQMICVGCSMAAFDTLAEAAFNYGAALEPFLAEIKLAAGVRAPNQRVS